MVKVDIKEVSLREMVEAMAGYADDETFRWLQLSVVGDRGWAVPTVTLRVTMAQARKELGLDRPPLSRENPGIVALCNALSGSDR